MVEVSEKQIAEVCDKIRDIINDLEVKVIDEKLDEETAKEIREELTKIVELMEGW